MTLKHILVPIDGSEFSQQILPHVTQLFPAKQYHLTLLYVAKAPKSHDIGEIDNVRWENSQMVGRADNVDYEHYPIYASQMEESVQADFVSKMTPVTSDLVEQGYDVAVAVHFEKHAVTEIVRIAESGDVDLVAMATRGRRGVKHHIFGSISEQVLEQIHIPLLLFHPPEM